MLVTDGESLCTGWEDVWELTPLLVIEVLCSSCSAPRPLFESRRFSGASDGADAGRNIADTGSGKLDDAANGVGNGKLDAVAADGVGDGGDDAGVVGSPCLWWWCECEEEEEAEARKWPMRAAFVCK